MGVVELEAAAALYAGAMIERLGPFTLTDRLVELWLARGLPIGTTAGASDMLDRYWLHRGERLPDEQRQAIYARVFDVRFDALWAALLASLAQAGADAGERADDVRAHLAARVDEATLAVTARLHAQLGEALAVLGEQEILDVHGARDVWQLIDQRARLELGTVPDVFRARTMAASGTAIIGWLADEDDTISEEVADAARSWLGAAAPAGG